MRKKEVADVGQIIVPLKENMEKLRIRFEEIRFNKNELTVILNPSCAERLLLEKEYKGYWRFTLDKFYPDISEFFCLALCGYKEHKIVKDYDFYPEGYNFHTIIKTASGHIFDGPIGDVFVAFKNFLFLVTTPILKS